MRRGLSIARTLRPCLDLLRQEYVLVQAWKKTASYIRQHNWFSDTLELDLAAVDLPTFLDGIARDLEDPSSWKSAPLRLVLAPKSQDWWVHRTPEDSETSENVDGARRWLPRSADPEEEQRDLTNRLRPLAHVALRDQVVATALMLCLADRVETLQGDPRRRKVNRTTNKADQKPDPFMSYGNRLFCDREAGELRHRWGSMKLYGSFYQDYRTFLGEPWRRAAKATKEAGGSRTVIVQADIRRFYDQVTPDALHSALVDLRHPGDDPEFFELAERVLCWEWDERDRTAVERYVATNETRKLDLVALPQGLVSAGFWANVALLKFDGALKGEVLKEARIPVDGDFRVAHACRYVDDIRVVVLMSAGEHDAAAPSEVEDMAEASVTAWIQEHLDRNAAGLKLNCHKTKAVEAEANKPGRVLQSQRMNRIQSRVSGGFSASEGLELLEAIQGLLMLRAGFTRKRDSSEWTHAPKADVPEDTRARFGAFRYRKVVREIRAMLPDDTADAATRAERSRPGTSVLTRKELDEMTRTFALVLVDKWVHDPSNVRILLTALDLWPDATVLEDVLKLLVPWTEGDKGQPDALRVAWYCLSEVIRAGATETGLVQDEGARPDDPSIKDWRRRLVGAAWKVIRQSQPTLPWYLRQQAFLLLFTSGSLSARLHGERRESDPKHYLDLAAVLAGKAGHLRPAEYARHAVVLHRCFNQRVPGARWTRMRLEALAQYDPGFAAELLKNRDRPLDERWSGLVQQLLVEPASQHPASLDRIVMEAKIERNEPTLLRLALILLDRLKEERPEGPVPPWQIRIRESKKAQPGGGNGAFRWHSAQILDQDAVADLDLWRPPAFCRDTDRWRYQLGYLLRFVLARSPDFTANVNRSQPPVAPRYRSAVGSWAQRRYGGTHSQGAFGGDWLPISDWFERFLSALLWWPGRREDGHTREIDKGIEATRVWVEARKRRLDEAAGKATAMPFLPMAFSSDYLPKGLTRLRACIVQTTNPDESDFDGDLTLSSAPTRPRHRNHLTNALALVRQGLRARRPELADATDASPQAPDLDLLVLPELSVHPQDVERYLVPFAQTFKTIILAGVVYEELPPETTRLANTAVWVVPEYSEANGWNVRVRRQGKQNLAEPEQGKHHQGRPLIGYRPCQWIIECPSSPDIEGAAPLRLSAAVCYDATDLALAADLRERSDVFLIPALNKDVQTFDNLAVALSYQMYQLVAVANNGRYGGSSAHWPIGETHERRLLHLHGQNQPTLGFFEIPDVVEYRRTRVENLPPRLKWKAPPAGFRKK